jgi:virginiamycin B lyase
MLHLNRTPLHSTCSRAVWLPALLALFLVSLASPVRAAVGTISEFPLPSTGSWPSGIALWFTENNGNKIGRISPSGTMTEFAIKTASANAQGIAQGPDNALWFTEVNGNKIGRIITR